MTPDGTLTFDKEMLEHYARFVLNRHLVWTKRQAGESAPWTRDPIIATRKFTNVFRVLDYGSQFLVRELTCHDPVDYLARCIFYRVTNSPKTWTEMKNVLGDYPTKQDFYKKPDELFRVLDDYRSRGNTVFSGAYVIIPSPGTNGDKIRDAINLTRHFLSDGIIDFMTARTQAERFAALRATPGLGPFLSMQILTDWGYAQPINRENEFIVAGPGARKGASYLSTDNPEDVIRALSAGWDEDEFVRLNGHPLGLMNVQNTLCEFSKLVRYMSKPLSAVPYRPAHPGPQPEPALPDWMK